MWFRLDTVRCRSCSLAEPPYCSSPSSKHHYSLFLCHFPACCVKSTDIQKKKKKHKSPWRFTGRGLSCEFDFRLDLFGTKSSHGSAWVNQAPLCFHKQNSNVMLWLSSVRRHKNTFPFSPSRHLLPSRQTASCCSETQPPAKLHSNCETNCLITWGYTHSRLS